MRLVAFRKRLKNEKHRKEISKMNKFHIYCHIPYCKRRCNYCYFTAKFKEGEMTDVSAMDRYVDAMVKDITQTDIPKEGVNTVVFGGGTPSLLNYDQLHKIIAAIKEKVSENAFKSVTHVAYEVSPDTGTYETLKNFREVGFNRVSIGAQSFNDNELKILGRPYTAEKIEEVMKNIRALNYELVNLDLLIATPGQTVDSIIHSVAEAVRLRPEHLSVSLFYKSYPGGRDFVEKCAKAGLIILDLEDRIYVYDKICNMIIDAGYIRVDNTVFSLPGHIYDYEKDSISGTQPVLAFGPGSSGYWNGVIRYTTPEIEKYIENPVATTKELTIDTNAFATIWGHFNAYGNVDENKIMTEFNKTIDSIRLENSDVGRLMTQLEKYDLVIYENNKYVIKQSGLNKAIVIMHSVKDDWGYQLITAPKDGQK